MNHDNPFLAVFGRLANAAGGGGDYGQSFPKSDADDLGRGAHFIPGQVTLARRAGQRVEFVRKCGPCCWHWVMPDGARVFHWDRGAYESIARANQRSATEEAGPCPHCANAHTNGGTHKAEIK